MTTTTDLSRSMQALNAPAFNGGSRRQEEEQPFNSRLLITSPFLNGEVAERLKYQPTLLDAGVATIGLVVIKDSEDDLHPFGKVEPVRRECLHWAPRYRETGDCRFACGATA